MKALITLVFSVIVTSCVSQKTALDEPLKEVEFKAQTRGVLEHIIVENDVVIYKTQNSSKTLKINKEEKDALQKEIAGLDVKEIPNFKVISDDRAFDAAMHATVSIKVGDDRYTSATFDHHNPPEELKVLVELLRGLVD